MSRRRIASQARAGTKRSMVKAIFLQNLNVLRGKYPSSSPSPEQTEACRRGSEGGRCI